MEIKKYNETNELSSLKKEILKQQDKYQKLASFFNLDINSKSFKQLILKLNQAGLQADKFLSKYKNIVETNLSGLKDIPNGKKYKEKIKEIIGKRFLSINEELEELKEKVEEGKTIYDYPWDINDIIQDKFHFINKELLPSIQFLIKEGGKVNGTTSYTSYILSNGEKNGKYHIDTYKKIEETIKMLDSEILENGEFDKTWKSGEIIDANTNTWNIFDIESSTDGAILKQKGIKEIGDISILSEKQKQIEAQATIKIIGYILALLVPVAGDIASLPADTKDLLSNQDGLTSILKQTNTIPQNYNRVNSLLDRILGGVGILASIAVLVGAGVVVNKAIKSSKLAKYTNRLKKLGIKNPEEEIQKAYKSFSKTSKPQKNIIKEVSKPSVEIVKRNAKLKDLQRKEMASKLIKNNLSKKQEEAIIKAHNIGKTNRESGIYNYSFSEIKQKYNILKDAGFTKKEIKILMDYGIVGKMPEIFQLKKAKVNDIIYFHTQNSVYVFKKIGEGEYECIGGSNEKLIGEIINKSGQIRENPDGTITFLNIKTSTIKNIEIKSVINSEKINYNIGTIVNIKRSDGRVHEAKIVDIDNNGYFVVNWEEGGKTYRKSISRSDLDKVNKNKVNHLENKIKLEKLSNIDLIDFSINLDSVSQNFINDLGEKAVPKYKVIIEGKEFLLTNKDTSSRTKIIAYTKVNETYQPRLFYFSKSGGNWHSSPGIRYDGGYSKGEMWDLSYEKGTIVEEKLANKLSDIPIGRNQFSTRIMYSLGFDYKRYKEIEDIQNTYIVDGFAKQNLATITHNYKEKNIDSRYLKYLFSQIDTTGIDKNFHKIIDGGFGNHKYLGKIKYNFVETFYNGEPIKIIFAHSINNRPDLVWIENIEFKNNSLSSFGFNKKQANAGLLTTKPLEYWSQIPLNVRKNITPIEGYGDIREFMQENPLIKIYKSKLSG